MNLPWRGDGSPPGGKGGNIGTGVCRVGAHLPGRLLAVGPASESASPQSLLCTPALPPRSALRWAPAWLGSPQQASPPLSFQESPFVIQV